MNETEFQLYCQRLNLQTIAIQYVQRVRASGPSRKVRCGPNNVVAKYPSRKMNRMVSAESHTVELAFIYQLEYDRDVVEYHAQPSPIKLAYTAASGRPTAVIHTPDFLVLKADEVGLVECKTEDDLQKLAITQPGRYRPALEGGWRCPPGEVAASTLGLSYRVWSSREIDQTLLRNIRFLGDYLAPDYPDLAPSLRKQIVRAVMNAPGTSAKRLVEDGEGWSYEDVFTLIGKNALYVDLREVPLTQLDRVRIFPDEQTALAMRFARLSQSQHDEPASSAVTQPSNAPGGATALVAHPAADRTPGGPGSGGPDDMGVREPAFERRGMSRRAPCRPRCGQVPACR